jgi:chemotaxis-related protein WspB
VIEMPVIENQARKLYLQLFVDSNRYALSAKDVVAIVPLVSMHDVPKAPEYIVGILNYHGNSVPVIDIRALLAGKKSENRLSTRIVIIKFEDENNGQRLIGVLAEKLTEVTRVEESEFMASGVQNDNAKFLGDVATDEQGILQRLQVSEILPKQAQQMLFVQVSNI